MSTLLKNNKRYALMGKYSIEKTRGEPGDGQFERRSIIKREIWLVRDGGTLSPTVNSELHSYSLLCNYQCDTHTIKHTTQSSTHPLTRYPYPTPRIQQCTLPPLPLPSGMSCLGLISIFPPTPSHRVRWTCKGMQRG